MIATGLATAANATLPWRFPFEDGAAVTFQGTVAAPDGSPLADLDVSLEASNPHFDWHSLSKQARVVERQRARTDYRGQFSLEWSWRSDFRHFELVVSIPVRRAGADVDQELARLDVTDRLEHGSPVTAALTVERSDFVARLRAFVGALATADERRVYEQLGLPESADRLALASGVEAAWWYFDLGRVARFVDGRLVEVAEFEPIRPTGSGEER